MELSEDLVLEIALAMRPYAWDTYWWSINGRQTRHMLTAQKNAIRDVKAVIASKAVQGILGRL